VDSIRPIQGIAYCAGNARLSSHAAHRTPVKTGRLRGPFYGCIFGLNPEIAGDFPDSNFLQSATTIYGRMQTVLSHLSDKLR
jgi:hypothetical protein